MKVFYVYIVQCSDLSYYTGITNNVERRLYEHNSGVNSDCYTFNRRPVKLMFMQDFNSIEDAIAAEKQMKGWGRKKKEALFKKNWDQIHKLAECRNSTSHLSYKRAHLDSARDENEN